MAVAIADATDIEDCTIEGQDTLESTTSTDTTTRLRRADPAGDGLDPSRQRGLRTLTGLHTAFGHTCNLSENLPANVGVDELLSDGIILEEPDYREDPCAGLACDATTPSQRVEPVLIAWYTQAGDANGGSTAAARPHLLALLASSRHPAPIRGSAARLAYHTRRRSPPGRPSGGSTGGGRRLKRKQPEHATARRTPAWSPSVRTGARN